VFLAVNALVALVYAAGNILVITTFIKTQKLRSSTNYYFTSIAVSDVLFVGTLGMLYSSSRLSVSGHSVSTFQCKLGMYLATALYSVSMASLVLTTVDRFLTIVFPLKVTMISGRTRTLFILLTRIIPLGTLVPYLYAARDAKPDELFLCTTDTSGLKLTIYRTVGFVVFYRAPVVLIINLNVRIMKSLRRTNPVIQENSQRNEIRRKKNQRIMKVLISITVCFIICWFFYYLATFLFKFLQTSLKRNIQVMVHIVCYYFLPFVSTAFNPVILFTFSTNYHQALKNCLRLAVVKCRSRLSKQ